MGAMITDPLSLKIEIGQLGQRINVKLEEKYNDGQ